MSEQTDRFVIEVGSGTVAQVIDMKFHESTDDDPLSRRSSAPGEKMCSRGNRSFRTPVPELVFF